MMVVDASALVAVYLREPERDSLLEKLKRDEAVMSPIGLWETLLRATVLNGATAAGEVDALIANLGLTIVPADADTARLAAEAFARFGRRTPAGLNLGDCFAYALAKQRNAPLLFKGDDFSKTDIVAA